MKLGLIDIKKAYLGTTSITNSNAFVGTVPVIEGGGEDDRLRFVANAASSFYFLRKSSYQTVAQYSTDGTTWTDIPTSSASAVQMASGDTVYIRGNLTGNNDGSTRNTIFSMTGNIEIKGNIMYWYNYEHPELTTITYSHAFFRLFFNCSAITSVTELQLPATTLTPSCYNQMFYNNNITTSPELPATTLTNSCYTQMYYGCSHLTYIKCLATDISADSCVNGWTYNTAASGTFVKAASMSSWPTGANGIPSGWTVQNA